MGPGPPRRTVSDTEDTLDNCWGDVLARVQAGFGMIPYLSVCSFLFLLSGPPSFHLSPLCLRAEQAIWCFLPFLSSPGSSRGTPGHTWPLDPRVNLRLWGRCCEPSFLSGRPRVHNAPLFRSSEELPQDMEARAGGASYFGCRVKA